MSVEKREKNKIKRGLSRLQMGILLFHLSQKAVCREELRHCRVTSAMQVKEKKGSTLLGPPMRSVN